MKKKDNTNDQKIYLGKVIQNLQRPASNSSSFDDEMPKGSNDVSGADGSADTKTKAQKILDDLFSPFLNGSIGTNISEDTWKSIFGDSTTTKTTPYTSSLKTKGPISYKPDSTSVPNRDYLPNYNPETMAVKYEANPQKWVTTDAIDHFNNTGRGCEFCAHEHVYGKWMEFHHNGGSSESVEIPAKFCPNCGRRLEK